MAGLLAKELFLILLNRDFYTELEPEDEDFFLYSGFSEGDLYRFKTALYKYHELKDNLYIKDWKNFYKNNSRLIDDTGMELKYLYDKLPGRVFNVKKYLNSHPMNVAFLIILTSDDPNVLDINLFKSVENLELAFDQGYQICNGQTLMSATHFKRELDSLLRLMLSDSNTIIDETSFRDSLTGCISADDSYVDILEDYYYRLIRIKDEYSRKIRLLADVDNFYNINYKRYRQGESDIIDEIEMSLRERIQNLDNLINAIDEVLLQRERVEPKDIRKAGLYYLD
jgi:hypothetical protein